MNKHILFNLHNNPWFEDVKTQSNEVPGLKSLSYLAADSGFEFSLESKVIALNALPEFPMFVPTSGSAQV